MKTPTPRTDAHIEENGKLVGHSKVTHAFARQLEQELNEARRDAKLHSEQRYKESLERDTLRKVVDDWKNTSEMLMTVVCNSSGGDWAKESVTWQIAARRFVDEYYERLKAHNQLPHVKQKETK